MAKPIKKEIEATKEKAPASSMRDEIVAKLAELGFKATDSMDDLTLINKLSEIASNAQAKVIELETDSKIDGLTGKLNHYINGTEIDDLEFAERLYTANVHKRYLKLFRNADKELSMDRVWERIRKSGINPLSVREIFADRHQEPNYGRTE